MKIKQDFVINSSSCSYIVCIPDPRKLVIKLKEVFEDSDSEIIINRFYNNYGYINFYDIKFEDWQKIHKVMVDAGYVIMFDENGPENEPRYLNIAFDKTQINKLKKILEIK